MIKTSSNKAVKPKRPPIPKKPLYIKPSREDGYEYVTEFVKTFERPFDAFTVSIFQHKANRDKGIDNPLTAAQQTRYWNLQARRAKNYGEAAHTFAEMYNMLPFMQWIQDTGYKVIGCELKVYNELYKLTGRIDMLIQHTSTGKYVIVDYKPAVDFDKHYGNLLKPFTKYHHSKRNTFELQLGMYRLMGNIELPDKRVLKTTSEMFTNCIVVALKYDGGFDVHKCTNVPLSLIQEVMESRINYDEKL